MEVDRIVCGDCLEEMPKIPDKSIDMILCDLPYGTTACKWDQIIPFEPLWKEYKRLIKDHGAIVLTASQPFTSALVMSNIKMFKWEDVWRKSQATGFLNCKIMPMRQHENILVFGSGKINYYPQITKKIVSNIRPVRKTHGKTQCYSAFNDKEAATIDSDKTYPRSVIDINNANNGEKGLHPTQKPVALFEYLIKTYTNEGDLVLDNCIGSGTTAIAARNTGRHFIGIEKEPKYVEIARKRLAALPRKLTDF
jgi:site-specific DNA-methyltransferase (adenine-specific)